MSTEIYFSAFSTEKRVTVSPATARMNAALLTVWTQEHGNVPLTLSVSDAKKLAKQLKKIVNAKESK